MYFIMPILVMLPIYRPLYQFDIDSLYEIASYLPRQYRYLVVLNLSSSGSILQSMTLIPVTKKFATKLRMMSKIDLICIDSL